jgi:hypothetical protein
MFQRKIAITLAAGLLAVGLGVASAFADSNPPATTTTSAVTTTSSTDANGEQGDHQDGQQGVDEQGAANDVAAAAGDVQSEANNMGADDESGDQQGPDDQSGEQGDPAQTAACQKAGIDPNASNVQYDDQTGVCSLDTGNSQGDQQNDQQD